MRRIIKKEKRINKCTHISSWYSFSFSSLLVVVLLYYIFFLVRKILLCVSSSLSCLLLTTFIYGYFRCFVWQLFLNISFFNNKKTRIKSGRGLKEMQDLFWWCVTQEKYHQKEWKTTCDKINGRKNKQKNISEFFSRFDTFILWIWLFSYALWFNMHNNIHNVCVCARIRMCMYMLLICVYVLHTST